MEELMRRDEGAAVQERLERDLLKRQATAGPTEVVVAGGLTTEAAEAVLPQTARAKPLVGTTPTRPREESAEPPRGRAQSSA
eukprot:3893890-Amphidinium_carterae.3